MLEEDGRRVSSGIIAMKNKAGHTLKAKEI